MPRIDVGKATFSAAFPLPEAGYQVKEFANCLEGIDAFISLLDEQMHCVLEATGSYSMLLSYTLSERKYAVSVINPRQAAHFAQMMLSVTKTDRMDVPRRMLCYWQNMDNTCSRATVACCFST